MPLGKWVRLGFFLLILFLWIGEIWAQEARQGWLGPGQTFQAKAEKGKVLLVRAKTKKGIVCVLVEMGKKDFDWDLPNNKEMSIEPIAYATPEKPNFTIKVDHCDHPEGKLWYSYGKR